MDEGEFQGNLIWDRSACGISSDEAIIIFPNPVSEKVTIQLSLNDYEMSYQLSLCDEVGRLVKIENYKNTEIVNWDLTNLTSGVYNLRVQFDSNRTIFRKIIKAK
jgi:uncharacterized protein YPO0396